MMEGNTGANEDGSAVNSGSGGLIGILIVLTMIYLALATALASSGFWPPLPLDFAAALLFLVLPFAFVLIGLVFRIAPRIGRYPPVAILVGLVTLSAFRMGDVRFVVAWLLLGLFAWPEVKATARATFRQLIVVSSRSSSGLVRWEI